MNHIDKHKITTRTVDGNDFPKLVRRHEEAGKPPFAPDTKRKTAEWLDEPDIT